MRKNKHLLIAIGALIYIAIVVSLTLPILNKSDEQKAFAAACICGDSILNANPLCGEECDDGGLCTGDDPTACTSDFDCTDNGTCTPRSGDGCDSLCKLEPFCGDGNVDPGEACDTSGIDDVTCDGGDCTSPECGDGYHNAAAGESCDDNNLIDNDGCSSVCEFEPVGCLWGWPGMFKEYKPGDEYILCDNFCSSINGYTLGRVVNTDYEFCLCADGTEEQCSTNVCDVMKGKPRTGQYCGYTSCGDGTIDVGERCDDSNRANGDGCTDYCRIEFECGNNILESGNDEQCDDGNLVSGDGCSSACIFEGTTYEHAAGGLITQCDSIDPDVVCLWRNLDEFGNPGYVNNTVENYNPFNPKLDTGALEWYAGSCDDASFLSFPLFQSLLDSGLLAMIEPLNKFIALFIDDAYAKAPDITGKYSCLHIFNGDQYYNVYWTGYSTALGDDSFSYVRREYTPVCGNDIKEAGEECEDGNTNNGDGCSSICEKEGYRFVLAQGGIDTAEGDLVIDGEVNLWRGSSNGVFNTYDGADYNEATAASTIEWACGSCADELDEWYPGSFGLNNCINNCMPYIAGEVTCLHAITSDYYYDIFWLNWETCGGDENSDAGFSYIRNLYDGRGPKAISDLNINESGINITIGWTAPADNGGGEVARYELRYAESTITEENWDESGMIYISNLPLSAGSNENLRMFNTFEPGTYYFAMRSYDDSGNLSDLGNVFELILADNDPVITGVDPVSSVNDADTPVTITGSNFVGGTKDQVRFISDGVSFNLIPSGGTTTQLDLTMPAGVLPGEYKVFVNNNGGISAEDFTFTVTEAETNKLPVVTNIIPSYAYNGTDTDIRIYGQNFDGATSASFKDSNGITIGTISPVTVENGGTEIPVTIPSGISSTTGYAIVTTPNGSNYSSAQLFTISKVIFMDETFVAPVTVNYLDAVNFSLFSGSTTLNADLTIMNPQNIFVSPDVMADEIRAIIPTGTTLTDGDGNQYLGTLNPPRIVSKEEALGSDVYDQLTDNSVIFEMGDPDGTVNLSEDIVVTISMTSSITPIIWYYNQAEDKFEVAGKDGVKDGITYVPGGTVLSHVGSLYTVGILTDHLSAYVIGVTPSITNISPSSGVAGTAITITGTNFHPDAAVVIGGLPAASTVTSTETINAVVPGLGAGAKTVTVTNPDTLFATSSFTVTTPPGGGGDEETGGTSGGGGLGGGQAIIPTSDILRPDDVVNTKTSSVPSPLRETVTSEKTFTRPVEVSEDMIRALASGRVNAHLTGRGGTLIIKPSKDATIYLTIPQNISVESSASWDGKIMPPLVRSTNLAISRTGDAIQGSENRLYRGNVAAVLEVGSYTDTLEFSSPVAITVPVSWGNGTAVDIYRKANIGDPWQFVNTVRIRNNQVMFATDKLSLFAIARASNERREAITPSVTHAVAPSVSQVIAQVRSAFRDIQNHWAEAYITRLYNENIVSGKSTGIFAPNDDVSRAELVKIVLKTFMIPVPEKATTQAFVDVDMNAWYAPYFEKAKELKIISGFDGKIYPDQPVTRAEALKILLTAADVPLTFKTTINFKDTNANAWYMWYVRYAYENGIVSGYPDGTFRPGNKVTRAEVAKMTVKVIDNLLER